jgi:hypothetical protein
MNSNTVLAIAFLIAGALLTTTAMTTMVPSAFADNKQKAEDNSAAAIADCDDNDVEQAGFDCIAIAANSIASNEEESATLSVCKEVLPGSGFTPEDFIFTVTGNNPSPAQVAGDPDCVDVTIGPGEYVVSEQLGPIAVQQNEGIEVEGDCVQDPNNSQRATGEIQAGETQECRFTNFRF